MSEIKPWRDRGVNIDKSTGKYDLYSVVQSVDAEITELRARVAELEKDAMRYRFIRSFDRSQNEIDHIAFLVNEFGDDEFDEEIDKAMRDGGVE